MMRVNLFTINFKKVVVAGLAMSMLCLFGCGQGDQVKTISKQSQSTEAAKETATEKNEEVVAETKVEEASIPENVTDGFYFDANGTNITTDIDFAPVLVALGEPNTYFEAASCAFNGLDKYYTYDHFEIDTYPDGDKDYISAIVLIDDIVSTPEGLSLGASRDDVIAVYGDSYVMNGSSFVYTKGTTHLTFVFEGNTVKNISYDTVKLDD